MSIQQVAYQLKLGSVISKHKHPVWESREITYALFFGTPLFLLGLLGIISSVIRGFDESSNFIILFCMIPSTLLLSLALLSFLLHRQDIQIIYEQGLVKSYKGKVMGLRFDAITEVSQKYLDTKYSGNVMVAVLGMFFGVRTGTILSGGVPIYRYRFLSKNGTVITSDFADVGNYVKGKVSCN
jgi:hypothetical protein